MNKDLEKQLIKENEYLREENKKLKETIANILVELSKIDKNEVA